MSTKCNYVLIEKTIINSKNYKKVTNGGKYEIVE